jgi:hypothetical protein
MFLRRWFPSLQQALLPFASPLRSRSVKDEHYPLRLESLEGRELFNVAPLGDLLILPRPGAGLGHHAGLATGDGHLLPAFDSAHGSHAARHGLLHHPGHHASHLPDAKTPSTKTNKLPSLRGAIGPQGPQGTAGPQGPSGATGPRVCKGSLDRPGLRGPQAQRGRPVHKG